jgi:cell wall-associated NlpC family hydrolase
MYRWARAHHLTSRSNPRVGDIVIYGGGTHAAIYIGRGLVVSALNPRQGIRVTRLHALRAPFTAFIHTHLQRP